MDKFDKFKVPVLVRRGGKSNVPDFDYRAWCYFSAEELETTVPDGTEWGTIETEDGERQKTLAEYLGVDYVDGYYRLAPIHFPVGRRDVLRVVSMELWDAYLTPLDRGTEHWINQAELNETYPPEEV